MYVRDVRESFKAECDATAKLKAEGHYDYVVAGGGAESHGLMKEVNFSDTLVRNGAPCRTPGHKPGSNWSSINAHGWFSYEMAVKKNSLNTVSCTLEGSGGQLDVKITVGDVSKEFHITGEGLHTLTLDYSAKNEEYVRIRFDRISANTPFVYSVTVD
jgi:hypothetical protein